VLLNLLILNEPGETVSHGREVGGEGITGNAFLREGMPRFSNYFSGSSIRAKNNTTTKENKKRRINIETKCEKRENMEK